MCPSESTHGSGSPCPLKSSKDTCSYGQTTDRSGGCADYYPEGVLPSARPLRLTARLLADHHKLRDNPTIERTRSHPHDRLVSYYNTSVDIHPSASKHRIADEDIEHATTHAMTIEDQDDDTRLYLGPARNAALLEIATIVRDDGSELVIHAMEMRPKYQRLLPGS